MIRRVSVGERLAEDFLVGRWDEVERGEPMADSLFADCELTEGWSAVGTHLVALITASDSQEAHSIAHMLVRQKMAACVNIVPKVSSVFRRHGVVEVAEESILVVKTSEDLFQDVVRLVTRVHRGVVPEIVALSAMTGSSDRIERMAHEMEARTEVKIGVGDVEAMAWLNGADTAREVLEAMPLASTISLWGDEMYFPVPVDRELRNGTGTVSLGDIAYWPAGRSICIFLGGTPLSRGGVIKPLTPVEVIGRLEVPERFVGRVRQGERITMRR